MSGGGQYWNEDTQRWEDGTGSHPTVEPPPVPPAPSTPPGGWPGAGAGSVWHGPDAGGTVVDGGGGLAPEWATGASWPPVEQPAPPPATGGGPNRRFVWSVVVGAAVVGIAVSLVVTLVVGKGGGGHKEPVAARSSATVSVSPTGTGSPFAQDTGTPSDSASASASASPPAGYELRDDPEGFRIAVPQGWTRSSSPSQYGIAVVNYRSADSRHRLQVYQVREATPQASFDLYLSDQTPKPAGFQKLGLQTLNDGQFTGARLEYLATTIKGEPDVGTWHVYDERFVAQDSNIYAIASYGPDSDGRDDELVKLATALQWFCPPNTTCGTSPSSSN